MDRIALVFSGQGDQFPGMGKSLYENYEEAARVFDLFDRIRPGTIRQCFEGTEEELRKTENTQPCLFAVEMAAAEAIKARGIRPLAAAGFSVGEVCACTFAGMFTYKQGFELVIKRGELMAEAAGRQPSFMAAVLRLSGKQVTEICGSLTDVYPVNYNCPGQIVVAGRETERTALADRVTAAGGRMIPLKVSGAFHSPFMKTASDSFLKALEQTGMKDPEIPVYSNVTALPYQGDKRGLLAGQIMNPVRWEDTVRNMISAGADTFIEAGPGSTLSSLIRRTERRAKTYTAEDLLELFRKMKV